LRIEKTDRILVELYDALGVMVIVSAIYIRLPAPLHMAANCITLRFRMRAPPFAKICSAMFRATLLT